MRKYTLRRLKSEVLRDALKEGKEDIVVRCKLSLLQAELYERVCGMTDVVELRTRESNRVRRDGIDLEYFRF